MYEQARKFIDLFEVVFCLGQSGRMGMTNKSPLCPCSIETDLKGVPRLAASPIRKPLRLPEHQPVPERGLRHVLPRPGGGQLLGELLRLRRWDLRSSQGSGVRPNPWFGQEVETEVSSWGVGSFGNDTEGEPLEGTHRWFIGLPLFPPNRTSTQLVNHWIELWQVGLANS